MNNTSTTILKHHSVRTPFGPSGSIQNGEHGREVTRSQWRWEWRGTMTHETPRHSDTENDGTLHFKNHAYKWHWAICSTLCTDIHHCITTHIRRACSFNFHLGKIRWDDPLLVPQWGHSQWCVPEGVESEVAHHWSRCSWDQVSLLNLGLILYRKLPGSGYWKVLALLQHMMYSDPMSFHKPCRSRSKW